MNQARSLYERILHECRKYYSTKVVVSRFCEELNGTMDIGTYEIGLLSPVKEPYNNRSCMLIHEFGHVLEFKARLKNRNKSKLTYSTYGIEKRAWLYGIKYFAKLNLLPPNIKDFMCTCLESYSKKYGNRSYIRSLVPKNNLLTA